MINFLYSFNQEIIDILWIYSEYNFFKKNNYKVYYPKISDKLTNALVEDRSNKNVELLRKVFFSEFDSNKNIYQKTISKVSQNWQKIEKTFFLNLAKITCSTDLNFDCFISRYGPGGTYYEPNTICIRAILELESDLLAANETIAHEIVHLAIKPSMDSNNISFENTERLVDLILTKTAISRLLINPTIQSFGDERIDKVFINNKFNILETAKAVAVLQQTAKE